MGSLSTWISTTRCAQTLKACENLLLGNPVLSSIVIGALLTLLFVVLNPNFANEPATVKHTPDRIHTSSVDPNKDRDNGEWTPVEFTYPTIPACTQELSEIKPIPYRPFRWGDYHVTMAIRNMPWEDWIELDNQYESYHRIRAHRIRTRGSKVVQVMPSKPGMVKSGHDAALELVQELAEYLSRRYPTTFTIVRHSRSSRQARDTPLGWDGLPHIKQITIVPLNVTYDIPEDDAVRAMQISALLIQDDLALMIEGADGKYYFQAGAICVAGFWRMEDKIGLRMEDIHIRGNVPQYQEKLHTSLERFFRRMAVDKPVVRNNYFIQIVKPQSSSSSTPAPAPAPPTPDGEEGSGNIRDLDPEELAWSYTTNGSEDAYVHGEGHGHPEDEAPVVSGETLRLRSERQSLRRLPRTGAIVFTIRTYVTPVEALGREKGVPGRFASAVRSWPDDVRAYKSDVHYREELLDYLDKCHAKQVAEGVVVGDEEVLKKATVYPF